MSICKCEERRIPGFLEAKNLDLFVVMMEEESHELSHEVEDLLNNKLHVHYSVIKYKTMILHFVENHVKVIKSKMIIPGIEVERLKKLVNDYYRLELEECKLKELNTANQTILDFLNDFPNKLNLYIS